MNDVGAATATDELPACIEAVLARGGSVRSQLLSTPVDEYRSEVRQSLDVLTAGIEAPCEEVR